MRVTLKQIARELGISEAAVSLALNQKPGVSDETRGRVLRAARSMGYDMEHLRKQQPGTRSICLVHHKRHLTSTLPFFSELLGGVETEARNNDISVTTVSVSPEDNLERQLSKVKESHVDAILLLGTELAEAEWPIYARLGIPIVVLDAFLPMAGQEADFVTINNRLGGYQAARALLGEHRGCPGIIGSANPFANLIERDTGFMRAIQEAGYSMQQVVRHTVGSTIEAAEADFGEIIRSGQPLAKGYFAEFDQLAIGVIHALAAHGIRVPEDVSVIGFDDIELAGYVQPALSTIRVPKAQLGAVAVRRALEIAGTGGHVPLRLELATSYKPRASTL